MNPVVLSSESSFIATFLASFLIWFMFGGLAFLWLIDGKIKKEIAMTPIALRGRRRSKKDSSRTSEPFGMNETFGLVPSIM